MIRKGLSLALIAAVFAPAIARAQTPATAFTYGKKDDVKEVIWKASAQAGFILTTGNSNTITLSGGAAASRNDGWNKIALEVAGAYAESTILTPALNAPASSKDAMGNLQIGSADDYKKYVVNTSKVTAANVIGKGRYDRFFTENNSGYLTLYGGLDQPAAKDWFIGGQIGYARTVVKNSMNLLNAEVGYDFSDVQYAAAGATGTNVLLHSIRVFIGYELKLTADTAITAAVEALINGNNVTIAGNHYGFGEASRLTGKIGLATKIYKNISFRFGFTAKYDNAPGPLSAPAGIVFVNYTPTVQKLDTITEAALVITFL
jgi:hypothetical protein